MKKVAFRNICAIIFIYLALADGQGQPNPRQFSAFQAIIPDVSYWSYGNNDHGQLFWQRLFPNSCAGRFQSPVDIATSRTIYNTDLKEFAIFYDPPLLGSKFEVHNNGHTVEVNTVGDFYVTNGGLQNLYKTAQFHFHWGSNNGRGSEHTVDGERAPIEMHIVNWNRDKYNSPDEAGTHPDGLAVFSILFRIAKEDNPALEPIIRVLPKVRDPDDHVLVTIPAVSIKEFLPNSPDRYFRYSGSLTTPNCSETVIWTVFEQKQYISERQLHYFRQMLASSLHLETREHRQSIQGQLQQSQGREWRTLLTDNYRPVHDLHGRTVYRSFRSLAPQSDENCNVNIALDVKLHV
ncbi:carbonic anhydrase 1-like [Mercenaria mercenaria]|uniref:carbonic anhydrase 1-like n=1 Tax=Mercenaria mercenaria TaxID=6596 RepID=UPI00234FB56D|nr:carbonic anhydrase 1-like [Mercenaria mercenaria]